MRKVFTVWQEKILFQALGQKEPWDSSTQRDSEENDQGSQAQDLLAADVALINIIKISSSAQRCSDCWSLNTPSAKWPQETYVIMLELHFNSAH